MKPIIIVLLLAAVASAEVKKTYIKFDDDTTVKIDSMVLTLTKGRALHTIAAISTYKG